MYGFIKSDITQPAFMLPGIKSYATCIRFCPHLYQKKNNCTQERPALLDLPYRVVFAIGTVEQVLIYTSECVYPLAVVGNTHYATINDFAWDFGARKLLVASSDGYISVISFVKEEGESIIGEKLPSAELPEKLKPLFDSLDTVSYRKFEEEARDAKKNQFKPISFKSKNAGGVNGVEMIRT